MTKPIALFDTECYPNYWMFGAKDKQTGRYKHIIIEDGESLSDAQANLMMRIFVYYTMISFNGRGYDVAMIIGAMLHRMNTYKLKALNDAIIVDQMKPWQLGLERWYPPDHIDIMEVLPGAGGLKKYAGMMHCQKMQDLPYDPGKELDALEKLEVGAYNINDLDVLDEGHSEVIEAIELREHLNEKYSMSQNSMDDLRSKSDAQVAETVLWRQCERALGRKIERREPDFGMVFNYDPPAFLNYQTPQLQELLAAIRSAVFGLNFTGSIKIPEVLENRLLPIGAGVYRMGVGGLHSSEANISHYSDDVYQLRDIDVRSYYPNLMINSGAFPDALGAQFIREFVALVDMRVSAKARKQVLEKLGEDHGHEYKIVSITESGGKIMINGTFGKTKSAFSILFAPKMFIQTTLTGQLSILMLIEAFERAGIRAVSANTDGVVIKFARMQEPLVNDIIKWWENATNLELEGNDYRALHSVAVNDYVAIKPDGHVKRKGMFATASVSAKKQPDCEICADAVCNFLADGVDIEHTIRTCTDIRKFVAVQAVNDKRGGVKQWGEVPKKTARVSEMEARLQATGAIKVGRGYWKVSQATRDNAYTDEQVAELRTQEAYLQTFAPPRLENVGKVVRWYYSTQAPGTIIYATTGKTVSNSEGAKPCMILPDSIPSDIDYAYYINKAKEMLDATGWNKTA